MRLIDADALKNTIKNMPNDYYGDLCIGDALKEIDNAPTIDAVPVVRGEWIENPTKDSILCSYCHADWNLFDNDTYRFCYCPNCGAKMDLNRAEAEGALQGGKENA
ncbi:MAG: hypothetical protein WDA65_02785 [Christensenellales bacterium]